MTWTFKIELPLEPDAEEEWSRVIEIDPSSTLEDFHYCIQDAIEFDDDHLYEFYISRTERSRDRIRFDDENEEIYDLTLEDLYPLEKGKKLFYLFDYGDHWLFKVTKSRKKPQKPGKEVKYPRVIEEIGENPSGDPTYPFECAFFRFSCAD